MTKNWLQSALCAAAVLCAGMAQADDGKLTVQLNKFEPTEGGGCRAFFLFQNQTDNSFEGFEMSLAILDGNGVIDRLLSIDAAPLPVSRTVLKLFEIPQVSCDNISEILLHDLPVCKPQNAEPIDCFPILALESKTSATLAQ
ncbi:MAG: hypothetical protein AB3N15_18005 [Paracoccaceae bacterium]